MPRQDVPYGGAICRLKERIAEIWDELGKKLHSINGVEGDAAGDVKIVSGDAAVVVTSDQVNHEIEIALDSSQLPAASVSSVNGQTGAVVLDGDDIELINGAGVTAANAIIANGQRIATLQGNLNTEITNRQNADSALQTNINTLSASLPAAAAAAVAADPTISQLVTDLAGKVDLTDVSTVETPDTIAKRNGSGRLVAADPASGATDKTLVTANWVSQTGSGRPNNLIHDSGDEFVGGTKTTENIVNQNSLSNRCTYCYGYGNDSTENWWKLFEKTNVSYNRASFVHMFDDNSHEYSIFYIGGYGSGGGGLIGYKLLGSFSNTRVRVARKGTTLSLFVQTASSSNRLHVWVDFDIQGTSIPHSATPVLTTVTPVASIEPVVGADYDAVITPTVIQ